MKNRIDIKSVLWGLFFVLSACFAQSCSDNISVYSEAERSPRVKYGIQGTAIPCNIAPLNFQLEERGDNFRVRLAVAGKDSFEFNSGRNVQIPIKKWKRLLEKNSGEELTLHVFMKEKDQWIHFLPEVFYIAPEPIDPYLAYRLIEPGYEAWGAMGIYQRCLESFEETPLFRNSMSDGNCMNCHTFRNNNPDTMLFHVRAAHKGTVFVIGDQISKQETQSDQTISAGVYPRWHTDGKYVVFSTNTTRQAFHSQHPNRVEVYDLASDVVLYDTETQQIINNDLLTRKDRYETFPEWSSDGKFLYFCTAPAIEMPHYHDSLRYDLCRVAFDASSGKLLSPVDTLVSSRETGMSVSLPRISPDGRYLVFCMAASGTFPIWHKDNDLYMLDLQTGTLTNLEDTNSNDSDSYHSWSSNGRWMVFGSRRLDGLYTRPFIAYFDKDGRMHKPFLLPQEDPEYYDYSFKSYNIPELIRGKVKVSPYQLQKVVLN